MSVLVRKGIGLGRRAKWITKLESGMRNDAVVEVGEKKGGST